MNLELQVGPRIVADGSENIARAGRFGELFTSESTGRFYELSKQGRIFTTARQAGAAMGTALTATAVTLTLYNPSGSGVNLAILQSTVALTATQTTTATGSVIVYAANVDPAAAIPTTTTALTVYPALLGGAFASVARAYSAATLPAAPVVVRVHPFAFNSFTTNASSGGAGATDYVDGALCLAPGTAVTLQEIATTTTSSGIMSITWCEIPI